MDDGILLKHTDEKRWHSACYCPKCLFNFYKSKNKKSRLTWNSFLLHLLYRTRKSSDESIIDVIRAYVGLTSDKIKQIGYADRADLYKIISRVGKRINLDKLKSAAFWSTEDDPFIEFRSFVELNNIPQDKYLLPERRHTLIDFSGDVASYIERENWAGRKTIVHRDILRRFKKMRERDLLLVLGFLAAAKIILWNQKIKKVSMRKTRAWLGFHLGWIKQGRDEKIASGQVVLE